VTQRKTKPQDAITIRTYAELHKFATAFADGKLNLLFIIGRAGIAKSKTVGNTLGSAVCWIESNATAFGIYTKLWDHRDELVVIDDVDSLYTDRAAVRLLKCLCQTDPIKNIAWHSAAVGGSDQAVPREFQTTSRVCIIANDWKSLDANSAAVQDRGHLVFFEPTPEEVHRQVATWFWDQAIFDWFGDHLHLITQPSMRHYVRASELKESGIDWVGTMLTDTISEKALLVAKLRADTSFQMERDRVQAFKDQGGGSHETYYRNKRKLQPPSGEPIRITLTNTERPEPEPAQIQPMLRVIRDVMG
jgi:hypothetical protein